VDFYHRAVDDYREAEHEAGRTRLSAPAGDGTGKPGRRGRAHPDRSAVFAYNADTYRLYA